MRTLAGLILWGILAAGLICFGLDPEQGLPAAGPLAVTGAALFGLAAVVEARRRERPADA